MRRVEVYLPSDLHGQLVDLRAAGRGRTVSEVVRSLLQRALDDDQLAALGAAAAPAAMATPTPTHEMARRSLGILLKLEYLYERAVGEQGEAGERTLERARNVARRGLLALQQGDTD